MIPSSAESSGVACCIVASGVDSLLHFDDLLELGDLSSAVSRVTDVPQLSEIDGTWETRLLVTTETCRLGCRLMDDTVVCSEPVLADSTSLIASLEGIAALLLVLLRICKGKLGRGSASRVSTCAVVDGETDSAHSFATGQAVASTGRSDAGVLRLNEEGIRVVAFRFGGTLHFFFSLRH